MLQNTSSLSRLQMARSVPRNLRAQWNIGIIQAKEALSMSPDKRIENFGFIYDEDGPHLNPLILEKLKTDPSSETESRLSQDVSSLLVSSPAGPLVRLRTLITLYLA